MTIGAENTLRCSRCAFLVRDGHWYRLTDGATAHAGECPRSEL